jgi:hypothetical protein
MVLSNVTRSFNILARDMTQDAMENAYLTLYNQNNKIVWNGTTDSLGQANFNLTFTDSNCTDTLRLEASKGDSFGTTDVRFLSDTPVTLVLGRRDIATADVTPSKTVFGQGYSPSANVTVANQGDYTETILYISLYVNTTRIGTQTVYYLMNDTSTSTIVDGTATSSLACGNYTLSAYAWPVTDEMNTANNNCTCGQIRITIPGDVDDDSAVKLTELVTLARVYGSRPNDSNRNANADIDGNGAVGLSDLVILVQHYGQHYP